jgi:hypothetical protein
MGAWGHKPFENDSALDWFNVVEGVETVAETLAFAAEFDPDDYLDSDDGFAAIAAATLAAAAFDGDPTLLPGAQRRWLQRTAAHFGSAEAQLAVRAVARVRAENSELAELWAQLGDSEWHSLMQVLVARLSEFTGD